MSNIHWLAGLLEGEGSFILREAKRPVIQCAMTDQDVIEKIKTLYGGAVYHTVPRNVRHKPYWTWVLTGVNAVELMQTLLPLMGERRRMQIGGVLLAYEDRKFDLQTKDNNRIATYMKAGQDYLDGKGSLREIARRYKISQVTVLNYKRLIERQ